jgi:hypothetical protein
VGMMMFRKNDPFHFSKISSALFSVWRIETGDRWEDILKINMYGCDTYPLGYPMLNDLTQYPCEEQESFGYFAVVYVFFIVIIGGYIIPSILVGVIAVYMDKAFKRYNQEALMDSVQAGLMEDIQALQADWCTKQKLKEIQILFKSICHEDCESLDMNTAQHVFCHIISRFIMHDGSEEEDDYYNKMNLDLKKRVKDLLLLLDLSGDRLIDLAEFTCFMIMTKQVQLQLRQDATDPNEINNRDSTATTGTATAGGVTTASEPPAPPATNPTSTSTVEKTTSAEAKEPNVPPPVISIPKPQLGVGSKPTSPASPNNELEMVSSSSSSSSSIKPRSNSLESNISDVEDVEGSMNDQSISNKKKNKVLSAESLLSEEENEEEDDEEEEDDPDMAGLSRMEQVQRNIEKRKAKKAIEEAKQEEKNEILDAYNSAWMTLLEGINEDPAVWRKSIELLFMSFDRDKSGDIDITELGAGIKVCLLYVLIYMMQKRKKKKKDTF